MIEVEKPRLDVINSEWGNQVVEHMNRMAVDEEYREFIDILST
jgi:hypothetical protein